MDTHRRSLVKALIWNAIGLAMMVLVGAAFTGSFTLGGGMAVVNTGIGLSCYLVYERVWSRIRWGRIQHGARNV